MEKEQAAIIFVILIMSVACLAVPFVIWLFRRVVEKPPYGRRNKMGISGMILFLACLLGSIWCLRYAVGFYQIINDVESEMTLTWWEEIFNSFGHTLQTFSMDEDYTWYMLNGKLMLSKMLGDGSVMPSVYGVYVSILNTVAPIAGGAVIFEILANIFPKIKLTIYNLAFWKEKYYFSELNEASLALAKSVCSISESSIRRPVIIFTDAYIDKEKEKDSEMLLEAKQIGAICVRDDLSHVRMNGSGMRKIFLIDEEETGNLQTLACFANAQNCMCLKKSEIYFFTNDDAYVELEKAIRDKLLNSLGFSETDLPVFMPVRSYRNLISNLLEKLPLYEPLVGKERNSNGLLELTVTILGTGPIGIEMFLSTYWFGQMSDCKLTINILSQDPEEAFWDQINYINPEIRQTTIENDPILRINRRGDYADVYCSVNYIQCDVKSAVFSDSDNILDSDYFFIALGSDEKNIAVANAVRKCVGQHHLNLPDFRRTVIAYVVYDDEITSILNRNKYYCSDRKQTDIYMCAVGGLREVYGLRNIFMTDHEDTSQKVNEAYMILNDREKRADEYRTRIKDDYSYWANKARALQIKYKMFAMGIIDFSVFDMNGKSDDEYIQLLKAACDKFVREIAGGDQLSGEEAEKHMSLMHRIAWMEKRRWNAFTRIKGFRHTDRYDVYAVEGEKGTYKQMDLKLHPCLVECDKVGIRAKIDLNCNIDAKSRFKFEEKDCPDMLDDLSKDLSEKGFNGFDFKEFDYPTMDIDAVKKLSEKCDTMLKAVRGNK